MFRKEKSYLAWYHQPPVNPNPDSRRIGVKTAKPGVDYRQH